MKRVYKAEGGGHSWDWLALVSPCVEVLRKLSKKINHEFGTEQGSKHTIPDLRKDIIRLMNVLKEHDVYEVIPGRAVDVQDRAAPDVMSVGIAQLSHGNSSNPISDFNQQFERMRERRKLTPIMDELDFNLPGCSGECIVDGEINMNTPRSVEEKGSEESSSSDDDADQEKVIDPELEMSPTLECVDEDDVALDMDGWELHPESEDEMSEGSEGDASDFE
jgi:hypothetical protein